MLEEVVKLPMALVWHGPQGSGTREPVSSSEVALYDDVAI